MKTMILQRNKLIGLMAVMLVCFIFTSSCKNEEYEYSPPAYLNISGVTSTTANSTKDFYTFYIEGASYTWAVPSGSTIKSGQGTSHIQVLFGNTGGTLSVEAKGMTASIQITIL